MKTKTYDFKEFVKGERMPEIKAPKMSLIPLAAVPLAPSYVFAAEENIKVKVMNAFQPLIDLIMAFAYPGALAVMLGGALFIIFGNSEKGFSMIQKAGIGYVALMLLPMVFDILADAMAGVA